MIVYYHIPEDKAKDAISFGMKLSEYGNFLINIGNGPKNVITAYLCPADDVKRYNRSGYTCLCIDFPIEKTYIMEGVYLETENTQALKASLTKAAEYRLGSYRKPLALITTTVFAERIKVLGKYMDVPMIVDDSEELYLKNALLELEEGDSGYYEKALYGYLTVTKEAHMLYEKNGYAEYILNKRKYIVRKPDGK